MLKEQLSFNDGLAEIYTVDNIASPGDKPKDGLTDKRVARFTYRTMGAVRFYEAQQVNVKLDRLILIPKGPLITPQSVVILRSEDGIDEGVQYIVRQAQIKTDTKPHSVLVSLERVVEAYEIAGVP